MIASAVLFLGTVFFLWGEVEAGRNNNHNNKGNLNGPSSPSTSAKGHRKPNIVLILTDDQDIELGSLKFMPKTLAALKVHGAEFRHAYVTTPMCCPSRSSLLTGMYVHNHHVYTNNDNCSSTQWQATHETKSFATYLSNAGYRTGYFGKYLNKYNGSYVPPGWREWGGLIMNSKYYNYSINMNGKKIKHGFDYHKDYYPDLIANDSVAFLRQSKKYNANKPVMLTMSFPAPHGPEDSAPQYSHLYFNVTTHHTPSYDYAPNPDKQWILQVTKRMLPIHKQFTDLLMTKRLQTLQSVDAAVELVVNELDRLDELNNTYIIYTSDHGYHLGQFGLIKGKSFPFEFDVRVPFLIRGPGVEPGLSIQDIVLNIDLAPTFLDIAGVEIPPHMDGRSILPLFTKKRRSKWPDTFLIESSGRRETPYLDAKLKNRRVEPLETTKGPDFASTWRTPTKMFEATTQGPKIHESGEDSQSDFEDDADDDFDDDDDEEDDIDIFNDDANMHRNLTTGEGKQQTRDLFAFNKLERLNEECVLDDMKPPCKVNQKWFCFKEQNRWRKRKCKSNRKCACVSSAALVYKKVQRNMSRRHARIRRDMEEANNLLKAMNVSNSEELTNKISESLAGCVFLARGQVNCSARVYQDRKSWRQSRHQINNEIHQLKQKLERLKEIRRRLKHTKPNNELDGQKATTEMSVFANNGNNPHRHNHHQTSPTSTEDPLKRGKFNEYCDCEAEEEEDEDRDEEERARQLRQRLKEEKLRRKLRKQRKRDQLEKECGSERMNCFHHDKEHWKTAPMWTQGPFCFCMNANNNTYSCVRTINVTHNFLYCEFTTGLVTFYNLRTDPYELKNQRDTLKQAERTFLHEQLKQLMACKGKHCVVTAKARANNVTAQYSAAANPQHKRKRKLLDEQGGRILPLTRRLSRKSYGRNSWVPPKYKRSRSKQHQESIQNAAYVKKEWN